MPEFHKGEDMFLLMLTDGRGGIVRTGSRCNSRDAAASGRQEAL